MPVMPFNGSIVAQLSRICAICRCPRPSCSSSRGRILPAAARDTIRSRSPTCAMASRTQARRSSLLYRASTASARRFMAAVSLSGIAIHSRIRRDPIGLLQQSRMSIRALPSGVIGRRISSDRMVKRSIHIKLLRSMRLMERMWEMSLCSVRSR